MTGRLGRLIPGGLRLVRSPVRLRQDCLGLLFRVVTAGRDLLREQMRPFGDAVSVSGLGHVADLIARVLGPAPAATV